MEDFLVLAAIIYLLGILPAITIFIFICWTEKEEVTFDDLICSGILSWLTVLIFFIGEIHYFWEKYFGEKTVFDFTRRK